VTGGEFRDVDRDLLADYVGGALDGTVDGTTVECRIAADPAWAAAHSELVAALQTVESVLAVWGGAPEPIPPDVVVRLSAALAAEGLREPHVGHLPADRRSASQSTSRTSQLRPSRPALAGRHPDGPATAGGHPSRPIAAAGRRRRRRWPRLAALATAMAAFAGIGLNQLLSGTIVRDAGTVAEGGQAVAAPEPDSETPHALLEPLPYQVLVSGTDYQRATLVPAMLLAGQRVAATTTPGVGQDTSVELDPTPVAELAALTDPTMLTTCFDAIRVEHAKGAVAVEFIDYATFDGAPALMIAFTDPTDARWAWVSGPGCGQPGAGADTRHSTQVG